MTTGKYGKQQLQEQPKYTIYKRDQ